MIAISIIFEFFQKPETLTDMGLKATQLHYNPAHSHYTCATAPSTSADKTNETPAGTCNVLAANRTQLP